MEGWAYKHNVNRLGRDTVECLGAAPFASPNNGRQQNCLCQLPTPEEPGVPFATCWQLHRDPMSEYVTVPREPCSVLPLRHILEKLLCAPMS